MAAHLSTLLEREARLGPAGAARERELLTGLLGEEVDDPNAVLADRIREGDDESFEARAWPVDRRDHEDGPGDRQARPRPVRGRVSDAG